ncbi:MAG TPA: alpha/beta hydrolase [Mesorhizobium sp.]|jgi:pimeloyl-ACP methyl ester carboxylesterase|nr:alpha/beta hydrolase [Mesorhizobium sp.]
MAGEATEKSVFFSAQDGLRLHARVFGEPSPGLAVVCLPGLTRNARDFSGLARHLAGNTPNPRRVVAFDYRGRGLSAHARDWRQYNLATEAEDVLAGLTALGLERAAFIGTSRGGLIVHLVAAMRPGVLGAVVLNDVGPALGGAGMAQIKNYLERPPGAPRSFAEAVATQKRIHGAAFPALAEADWQRFTAALYREENGRPVLDFDPALVNTVKAIDLSLPLPEMWAQFAGLGRVPLLAIRGANSRLLTEEILDAMHAKHKDMQSLTVPGQGHAPLLDMAGLPERIAAFLDEAAPAGS